MITFPNKTYEVRLKKIETFDIMENEKIVAKIFVSERMAAISFLEYVQKNKKLEFHTLISPQSAQKLELTFEFCRPFRQRTSPTHTS